MLGSQYLQIGVFRTSEFINEFKNLIEAARVAKIEIGFSERLSNFVRIQKFVYRKSIV